MTEPTLGRLLERAAGFRRGVYFVGARGVTGSDRFVSYARMYERAKAAAYGLRSLGVRAGDRVGIVLPTGVDFLDAFYGAVLLGAVPVPLYPPVRLGRLEEYHARTAETLRICGVRLLLTDRRVGTLLGGTLRKARLELGAHWMSGLPRGGMESVARSADETALIQLSSGTQLSPKPVRLTHGQIVANVEAIRRVILDAYPEGRGMKHVGVSWLPLYHDMGLIGSVLTALAHPSDLYLMSPGVFVARPATWLRTISRVRGTVSAAPHFAYSLCAERIRDEDMEGVDLSSWRLALDGAEPVTEPVLDRFIERFRPFGLREEALTPVYGLAEAALAVSFSNPLERFRGVGFDAGSLAQGRGVVAPGGYRLVSVGRPLPGYALRVVTGEGEDKPLPDGWLGRVQVEGPSIMEGYHGCDQETAEVLKGGWLDTGDTGLLQDGELYLYGREKDLIIVRGRNHSPEAVEQCLVGLAGLRQGCWAAVGVVGEAGEGEALVLLIERARGAPPSDASEIERAVRERVAASTGLVPVEIALLEPGALPRTSSGKIRRQEAKRRYLAGTLGPPHKPGALRLALEAVRSFTEIRKSRGW